MTGGTLITPGQVLVIARRVARSFKRRWRWADVGDMTSVAILGVLAAQHTFDPDAGVPFARYAERGARLRVASMLRTEMRHVGRRARYSYDASVDGVGLRQGDPNDLAELAVEMVPDASLNTDEALDALDVRLGVRQAVRRLAERTRNGEHALAAMLGGDLPAEPVDVRQRYNAVHLVRRKARADPRLRALWLRARGL